MYVNVCERERDCVKSIMFANGSSSKNSPRVSANGQRLAWLGKKIGGKMRDFFLSLGSLVIVLAIASSGGLNVGNAKLPFRIGWTRTTTLSPKTAHSQ